MRSACAQLSDCLGWELWAGREPAIVQAHSKLVDIWRFMLSHAMVSTVGDVQRAVDELNAGMVFPHMEQMQILGKKFCISGMTLHEKVDILSAFASVGYTFPALFEAIMKDVGLSWQQLRTLYVGDAVLQMFRDECARQSGGTYQPVWDGVNDDVRLAQILESNSDISAEALRDELARIYEGVTA